MTVRGKYFVYALCDPRKDFMPFYIGKGTVHEKSGIFMRWVHHLKSVRSGCKNHRSNKIRKIFEENLGVGFEILSWWESEKDAYREEIRVIAEIGLENLTNDREGGEGGYKASQEQREKMSEAHRGQSPWNKGKLLTGMSGKQHSEETKKKISETAKKNWSKTHGDMISWNKGKKNHLSRETLKKMSIAGKKRKYSEERNRKISKGLKRAYAEGRRSRHAA